MESELELTRERVIERIEREAQRRLGLSAREFLLKYQGGRPEDGGEFADLLTIRQLPEPTDPLLATA